MKDTPVLGVASEDARKWYEDFYGGLPTAKVEEFHSEFSETIERGYDLRPNYLDRGYFRDSSAERLAFIGMLHEVTTEILAERAERAERQ